MTRKWTKKTPEQTEKENKKLYETQIKKRKKEFHLLDRENKLNEMKKRLGFEIWLINAGENNIQVIQEEIKKITVNIIQIKNLIKEEDFEGFEREYLKSKD